VVPGKKKTKYGTWKKQLKRTDYKGGKGDKKKEDAGSEV